MRVVNVSPHLLADVISCESKAWTRHVRGFTSRGDAIKMIAGQGFHKAMEVLLDPAESANLELKADAAVDAFHGIYDDAFLRLAPEKLEPSLTPQNLDRVLQRWIQMHPPAMLPCSMCTRTPGASPPTRSSCSTGASCGPVGPPT